MNDKIYTVEEIRALVAPIARKYGVERVYLFGSYARGEATSASDLDFRIDKGQLRGLAFGGFCSAFSDILNKPVDVVTTKSLDQDFLSRIAKEEVLIYAN